jgi:hypothetical protein
MRALGNTLVVIPARRLNFQSEFEINPPSRISAPKQNGVSRTHFDALVRDHRDCSARRLTRFMRRLKIPLDI